eukprot:gene3350-5897_t
MSFYSSRGREEDNFSFKRNYNDYYTSNLEIQPQSDSSIFESNFLKKDDKKDHDISRFTFSETKKTNYDVDDGLPPNQSILDSNDVIGTSFYQPENPTIEKKLDFSTPNLGISNVQIGTDFNLYTPHQDDFPMITPNTNIKSPAQMDPFYETGGNIQNTQELEQNWITVFGFTPKQTGFVLKQFGLYGEILEHKVGNGNWMHIKYKKNIQAQKALSKNGKIFNSLMIGVVECIDKDIINEKYNGFVIENTLDENSIFDEGETPIKKRKYSEIKSEKKITKEPQKAGYLSSILDFIFKP